MTLENFMKEFGRILECEPETVAPDQKLETLEEWSSLSLLALIAFADNTTEKQVNPSNLTSCSTPLELFDCIFKE